LVLSHHFHAIQISDAPKSQVSKEHPGFTEGQLPKTKVLAHDSSNSVSQLKDSDFLQPPEETQALNHQLAVNNSDSPKSSRSAKNNMSLNNCKMEEEQRKLGSQKNYIFKTMIRGFTSRISAPVLEDILLNSKITREDDQGSDQMPQKAKMGISMPHPKAILVGILENFEAERREEISGYSRKLEEIQTDIKKDRIGLKYKDKELAVCNIQLCETNVSLGEVRPKLQYLASSIAVLESCSGTPDPTGDLGFDCLQRHERDSISQLWIGQLSEVKTRILQLKGKCEQCKIEVETLQHRLTGNLLVASPLERLL
jgi:hypothetical protein